MQEFESDRPRIAAERVSTVSGARSPIPISSRFALVETRTSAFKSAAEWLNSGLLPALRTYLRSLGAFVPARTRINRGFPPKRGWPREAIRAPGMLIFPGEQDPGNDQAFGAADGYHDIFVNPRISHPLQVATIVLHYVAVASLGAPPRAGRSKRLTTYTRKPWKELSRSLGFEGRALEMRAGSELTQTLRGIVEPLGPYPEGEIERYSAGDRPPRSRFLKVWCPNGASSEPAAGGRNEHFQGRSTEHYRGRLPKCSICDTRLAMAPPRGLRRRKPQSPQPLPFCQPDGLERGSAEPHTRTREMEAESSSEPRF